VSLWAKLCGAALAAVASSTLVETTALSEPPTYFSAGLASKKGPTSDAQDSPELLATLVQVHTGERAALDADTPTQDRFDTMLEDRATGEKHGLDEHLLGLLRQLAARHPGSRIELVSGYRSWKLNEMLRKKGHHVASHSQHSLGHACDFRIIPPGADEGLDPRVIEREIRALGWEGGVGTYPTKGDWFVHADVGRKREWVN
jgi:uncharacterized protein YcbK (DUF882 family)